MRAEVPDSMSDTAAASHDPAHPNSDHGDNDHGGGHGQGGEELGPIDVVMWSVGLLGVALGLLVALCVAFAVGVL
jgi:hypothetical protein